MRKKLKIIYFIVLLAYFIPLIYRIQDIIDSYWYTPVFLTFMIPYSIYESIQLIKDDKINNTNKTTKQANIFCMRRCLLRLATVRCHLSSFMINLLQGENLYNYYTIKQYRWLLLLFYSVKFTI